jgi:hypothetical protein
MSWKSIVGTVAPGIATMLGGPLAGMAVRALGSALLGDENASEDAVETAVLQANPEALAKVRVADKELTAKLAQAGVDLERMAKEDRAGARAMAISTTLKPQVILAGIFIAGFVAILWTVFSGQIALDDTGGKIAMMLIGILAAGVTQIMNFFFGSSSGSKEKTILLGKKP